MVRIRLNENQLNNLFEYHAQQRLPFKVKSLRFGKDDYGEMIDDIYFSKKNAIENYIDWIEEYGKVGSLGKSSIDFIQGFKSGFDKAFSWYKSNYFRDGEEDDFYIKQKFYKSFSRHGFYYVPEGGGWATDCEFNEMGNMYVERAINLSGYNIGDAIGDDMFHDLINRYQDNVGGCWSWKKGRAMAYCGDGGGSSILLRGWIRLDDIDWVETVYINSYNMNSECEIRVKPNAKVELFDILGTFNSGEDFYYDEDNDRYGSYDDYGGDNKVYKVNLGGRHIIVNSTYFGNNGKYNKEGYAEIYDSSSSEQKYMDRQGNILSKKDIIYMKPNNLKKTINILQQKGINGVDINDLFEFIEHVPKTPYLILSDYNMYCIFDTKTNKVIGDSYFDDCQYISNENFQCFKVSTYDGVNLFSLDGKFLLDRCYTNVHIINGAIIVYDESVDKMGVYKGSSTNLIFDDINVIYNYNNSVIDIIKNYLEVENEDNGYNIIDLNGNIISPLWFTQSYNITNIDGKNVIVCSDYDNNKLTFVDMLTSKIIKKM